ncbi:g3181 [Coccomyxa elongata]
MICITTWQPVVTEESQRIGRQSRFLLSAVVDGMILSGSLSDLQQSILPDASFGYATPTALQQQSRARFPGNQLTAADQTLSPPAALQQPRQATTMQQHLQQQPQQLVQQQQIMQVVPAPARAPAAFMAKLQKTSKGSESKPGSAFASENEEDGFQQPLMEATESRKTLEQATVNTAKQVAVQTAVKESALTRDTQKAAALAAARTASPKPPILLIHGGAQGGWVWSYPSDDAPGGVIGVLQDAGYVVYAPTLPYHDPGTQWSPEQGTLKAQDYVDYIIEYMVAESITEAVVVGHSVAGVWLQLLLGQVPERISRICFLDAVVLKTGESFISNSVGPAQLFFSLMFTYPSFPQPLSWPTGAIDLQAWKNVMITLEKDNDSFAVDTYKLLVPEPAGPQLEYLDFTAFYSTPKPKFFIFEQDDVSLLLGTNRWLDFAARLSDGVGPAAVFKVTGDHQGMLTRPSSIAHGILEAATAPL